MRRTIRKAGTKQIPMVILACLCAAMFGCTPEQRRVEEPLTQCDPGMSVEAIVTILNGQRASAVPVRASGKVSLRWVEEGEVREENPDIQLRFVPENRLFLDGRILGQEVVRLGTNDEEFWLRMKPEEVSLYQWGRWEDAVNCPSDQILNPHNLLEAMGMVRVDSGYKMEVRGNEYVLTDSDVGGKFVKRVYVNCSTYRVRKIEYYGEDGRVAVAIELGDYEAVKEDIYVPTEISIINYGEQRSTAELFLKNVRVYDNIKPRAFERPEPDGFNNVYRLTADCNFIRVTE